MRAQQTLTGSTGTVPVSGPIAAVDVGGTHLRWAPWSPDTGLGPVTRRRSPSVARTPGVSAGDLRARLVEEIAGTVPPGVACGVSFGAALDHHTGTVYASAPLWGPDAGAFDIAGALAAVRPDVRWHVLNDVTAALVHLTATHGGPGRRKLMLATISSGIACRTTDLRTGAIPLDPSGLQGEIGHLPAGVDLLGEPVSGRCECGAHDHLAAFSSGPGIRALGQALRARDATGWARSRLGSAVDAGAAVDEVLADALDTGDEMARVLLDAATAPVADLVRTALCLDPEIDLVALTGGVAVNLGAHYRRAVLAHLDRAGLYLTSEHHPEWLARRLHVCAPDEGNPLVGAALAAHAAEREASR